MHGSKEIDTVKQFLMSNWYDREEDDDSILDDLVVHASLDFLEHTLATLRQFRTSPISREEKGKLIKESVWTWFESEAQALRWFECIVDNLERKIVARRNR